LPWYPEIRNNTGLAPIKIPAAAARAGEVGPSKDLEAQQAESTTAKLDSPDGESKQDPVVR
jgi:hypothetical protein